ncbi:uncharacterized protein LOC124147208 [Haliotis rufescens]|uniref:uncharacterized protein LOC124147208 n=1 Tax=Haliotis rufescens TaxID=6454 RepID=UPI00201E889B|nr:uncharacterized protein LOC124147208 [Haliotis rufescens]
MAISSWCSLSESFTSIFYDVSIRIDGKVVTLQGLESSLAALENQVTGYNTQINDLSNSIASAALSSDLVELETSIGNLEGRIASAEEQNTDQVSQSVVDGLETRIGDLENALSSIGTSGVEDTSCESPWSYRSGPATCIYAAHDVKALWIEAKAWCEAIGPQYRFYIVNAFQKHNDLNSYINFELSDSSNDYYIGFSALNNQNYKWVDGSSEFSKWAWCWGKPDLTGIGCGSINNAGGFCLEDMSCEIKQKFICEKVIS